MTYAGWRHRVAHGTDVLPVRLPGRESRLREPAITDGARLVAELDGDLGTLLEEPHAFYGHSLGALVAYRYAQHRVRSGRRPPEAVFVGACASPRSPSALLDGADPRELTDDQLRAALPEDAGLPATLLSRPGSLATMLGTLRADLLLARSLRAMPGDPLPCPIEGFAGRDDRLVPVGRVLAWRHCTTAGFRLRTVDGGHFFVRGREIPRVVGDTLHPPARLPAGG